MPIDLKNISSGYNLSTINENFQKIEEAWDEKLDRLVSQQGNQMGQDLDLNGHKLLNASFESNAFDPFFEEYEQVSQEFLGGVTNLKNETKGFRDEAEGFSNSAATSAKIANSSVNIKGVFQPGTTNALQGETWIYDGSFWFAVADTSETPQESSGDWASLSKHNLLTNRDESGAHPASAIDGAMWHVDTIKDLQGLMGTEGQQVSVASYHDLFDLSGGGVFVWGAGRHNGGTFIDPTKAFPSDWHNQAQLEAWFADSGSVVGWGRAYDGAVNVKWFGAKGDGVADETTPIQTAINSGNKSVYVPEGTYSIKTTSGTFDDYFASLRITGINDLLIYGEGMFTLPSDTVRTSRTCIFASNCTNLTIKGITFDGNSLNRVLPSAYVSSDNSIVIADGCNNVTVKSCNFLNSIGFSILVYSKGLTEKIRDTNILNCYAKNCRQSVYTVINTIGGSISHNTAIEGDMTAPSVHGGIHLESAEDKGFDYAPIDMVISNNSVSGYTTGIKLWNSAKNVVVHNNIINDCSTGIMLREDMREVIAHGNSIRSCIEGIEFGSFSDINGYNQTITVEGNNIADCLTRGIFSTQRSNMATFSNNKLIRCGASGIETPPNSNSIKIKNNTFIDNGFNSAEEVPAIRIRGSDVIVSENAFIKTTEASKQYVVYFQGINTIFRNNKSIGSNVKTSDSLPYRLDDNLRLPETISGNNCSDPLLDENTLDGRFIGKNNVFTNRSGGIQAINASLMLPNRAYTFVRTNVSSEYWVDGTIYDYAGGVYSRIRVVGIGSFIVLVNRNGQIFVENEFGNTVKVV